MFSATEVTVHIRATYTSGGFVLGELARRTICGQEPEVKGCGCNGSGYL
jgi:hypothetical protein